MKNLITYEDISALARPCSTDREMAEALIAEAQRVEVKPRLGDALYLAVTEAEDAQDPRIKMILEGGEWQDSCGSRRLLTGVKTALAYYTLARIVRDGSIQATTYGSVVKDDQYSVEAERAERQRQYRELFGQADSYMAEVIAYLTDHCGEYPEYKVRGRMRSNRTTVKIIGR